jgi:hypothetical protein
MGQAPDPKRPAPALPQLHRFPMDIAVFPRIDRGTHASGILASHPFAKNVKGWGTFILCDLDLHSEWMCHLPDEPRRAS